MSAESMKVKDYGAGGAITTNSWMVCKWKYFNGHF